jgi:hypothetical protein
MEQFQKLYRTVNHAIGNPRDVSLFRDHTSFITPPDYVLPSGMSTNRGTIYFGVNKEGQHFINGGWALANVISDGKSVTMIQNIRKFQPRKSSLDSRAEALKVLMAIDDFYRPMENCDIYWFCKGKVQVTEQIILKLVQFLKFGPPPSKTEKYRYPSALHLQEKSILLNWEDDTVDLVATPILRK